VRLSSPPKDLDQQFEALGEGGLCPGGIVLEELERAQLGEVQAQRHSIVPEPLGSLIAVDRVAGALPGGGGRAGEHPSSSNS